jgi:hypothetical protein
VFLIANPTGQKQGQHKRQSANQYTLYCSGQAPPHLIWASFAPVQYEPMVSIFNYATSALTSGGGDMQGEVLNLGADMVAHGGAQRMRRALVHNQVAAVVILAPGRKGGGGRNVPF